MMESQHKDLATGKKIAHEVRQPLSAITILAGLSIDDMNKYSSAEKKKELICNLQEIVTQAKRCSTIMENFREAQNGYSIEFKPTDLNSIITKAVNGIQYRYPKDDITIQLNLQDELPPVQLDSEAIHEVLTILINNAIDAMQHSTEKILTINSSLIDIKLNIEVIDTGCGIAEEDRDVIFESLYSTKGADGMGIGLPLSKSIIDAHDGHMTVESKVAEGTKFSLSLPAK